MKTRHPFGSQLASPLRRVDLEYTAFIFALICALGGALSLVLSLFLMSGTLVLVGLGLLLFGLILAFYLVKTARWSYL